MVQDIAHICDVAGAYDAVVFDQWGVLHDGSAPYPHAIEALTRLRANGAAMAVLSNSGKRAAPNAERIAGMGFPKSVFDVVMTSGEALWQDLNSERLPYRRLWPITRSPRDETPWAAGLSVTFHSVEHSEAVLLMGLPDDGAGQYETVLNTALEMNLPVLCSNPDKASPRAGGQLAVSPGKLAEDYARNGGVVRYYGKPYPAVFRAIEAVMKAAPPKILMVGDSLEHDIKGAHDAGWDSMFVRGGLHARKFVSGDMATNLTRLAKAESAPLPNFTLDYLK